jgi:hypothetical protein
MNMRQHYVAAVYKKPVFLDFSCVIASRRLHAKGALAVGKPLPEPSGVNLVLADPPTPPTVTLGPIADLKSDIPEVREVPQHRTTSPQADRSIPP